MALHNTASRSQHWGGGRWKTAVIPIPKGCQSTQMELAIKSNTDEVHHMYSCNLLCAGHLHKPYASCSALSPKPGHAKPATASIFPACVSQPCVCDRCNACWLCLQPPHSCLTCHDELARPVLAAMVWVCRGTGHLTAVSTCVHIPVGTRSSMASCAPSLKPLLDPSCWSVHSYYCPTLIHNPAHVPVQSAKVWFYFLLMWTLCCTSSIQPWASIC